MDDPNLPSPQSPTHASPSFDAPACSPTKHNVSSSDPNPEAMPTVSSTATGSTLCHPSEQPAISARYNEAAARLHEASARLTEVCDLSDEASEEDAQSNEAFARRNDAYDRFIEVMEERERCWTSATSASNPLQMSQSSPHSATGYNATNAFPIVDVTTDAIVESSSQPHCANKATDASEAAQAKHKTSSLARNAYSSMARKSSHTNQMSNVSPSYAMEESLTSPAPAANASHNNTADAALNSALPSHAFRCTNTQVDDEAEETLLEIENYLESSAAQSQRESETATRTRSPLAAIDPLWMDNQQLLLRSHDESGVCGLMEAMRQIALAEIEADDDSLTTPKRTKVPHALLSLHSPSRFHSSPHPRHTTQCYAR